MGDREDRKARNEAVFRTLNERIRAVVDELSLAGIVDEREVSEYLCECAAADCLERIMLTPAEYELARATPIRFVIAPGHVAVEVERVVHETDRFMIVEKHPGERQIAAATDPRREQPGE
ncbi:MAG: hypothetical protein ICV59_06065 [Thermoleophilia bacterium]|nr:hypothetical protein [Thermoleophilia bacterium]